MREIRTLRATWRGLETWHGRIVRPNRRASSRPYLRERGGAIPPRHSPCRFVRQHGESAGSPCVDPGLRGREWPDLAPGENPHRGLSDQGAGLRIPWLPLRDGTPVRAKEKPSAPSGQDQGQDQTDERTKSRPHDRGAQSHAQGLVNIFTRLAEPDRHREAITSRPLLLHASPNGCAMRDKRRSRSPARTPSPFPPQRRFER